MIGLSRNDPAVLGILAVSVLFCVLLVLLVAAYLLIHHRVSVRRERQLQIDIRAVAAFLAPRLIDGSGALEAIEEARQVWGERAVVTVLRRTRQALRGGIAETASRALEEMGAVAELARTATSGNTARRVRALRVLGQCGGRQARAVLLGALDDDLPEVRRAAREALPAIRDDRSLRAALFSYLRDGDQRTAWRAGFFSKVAAHTPEALRAMVSSSALGVGDEKLAIEALAEVGDAASLRLAVARLDSPSEELRATAVRAVGKLEHRGAVRLLVPKLQDPVWIVRAAAARALGSSRCGALACWALGMRLADPVWWVRANAARTLSQQGDLGVLALVEALEGSDDFARETAISALALIDPGRHGPGSVAAAMDTARAAPALSVAASGVGGSR